jgi:DNA-binding MltR family transcriptional regulator
MQTVMAKRRQKENLVKVEDIKGFLEEFQGESDRAAAIVGAAYLDECLRQLIASFLIEDSTAVDRLLGMSGPLGTFFARMEASYCTGLISKNEYHDLEIIGEIRNEFAHGLHGLSFSDAWVRDKCSKLQLWKPASQWLELDTARSRFTVTTSALLMQLKMRTLRQESDRRVTPSEFEVEQTVH